MRPQDHDREALQTLLQPCMRPSRPRPGQYCTFSDHRPDPLEHDGLGPVHPGFFAGLPELWDRLKNTLTNKPCVVAGHSLGAARASLFTGLMVLADHPPVRRLCFGEPRSGFPQSASIIAEVRARSFCNGNGRAHVLVTDVPFTTWIEDYVHATPLIPISVPPSEEDVE